MLFQEAESQSSMVQTLSEEKIENTERERVKREMTILNDLPLLLFL